MVLSSQEIDQFVEQGYLKVPEVFPSDLAERILGIVWDELNVDPEDPSSWPGPRVTLKKVLEQPPVPEIISDRYVRAVDDLCGSGRWAATRGVGHWPILFPGFNVPPWRPPQSGWHIDCGRSGQVDSDELGLVGLEVFSDIPAGGGGTAVRTGSHSCVAQLLAQTDLKQLNEREFFSEVDSATKHLPVVELTGKTGDLFFMHPFTLHAESPNCSNRLRIIAVKLVIMKDSINLSRDAYSEYSPVELAILKSRISSP